MKKILAILLALTMVLALAVPAFAVAPEFIDEEVTVGLVVDGKSLSTSYDSETGKAGWGTKLFQNLSADAKKVLAAEDAKFVIKYTIEGNGKENDYGWWNLLIVNHVADNEWTVPNYNHFLPDLITHTFNGAEANQWSLNHNGEHTVVVDIPTLADYFENGATAEGHEPLAGKGVDFYENFINFGTQTGFPVDTAVIEFTSIDLVGTIEVENPDYVEPPLEPYFACAVLMMDDTTSKIYVEAGDIKYTQSMVMQVVDAQGNVLTQSTRNQADGRAYEYPLIGCSIFIKGECTDGWFQTTWTPDANAVPAKVLLVLDGVVRAEIPVDLGYNADYEEWTDVPGIGEEMVGNAKTAGYSALSGFVVISSEYHAQIGIGGTRVIIVNEHDFNLNGDCIYCGYHTEVEEDVVEIIDPTEPSTEEEEDETVEVTPDEEPEEDENPKTGLALALVPMMIAAAVAVITKK